LCDLEQFKKDPYVTFDYSYFVDNSPTMYVGNVRSSTPASIHTPVVDDENEHDFQEEPKKKSSTIPILSGIAVALIIVLIVLGVFFLWPLISGNTGKEIECPDFTGMTVAKVNEEYGDLFNIQWGGEKPSGIFEKGLVCEQSQKAGKMLKKGATITLYQSSGGITVKIPDVYGKQESLAISELRVKFDSDKIKMVYVADEDIEKDCVIKTEPARSTPVSVDTEITVYVSTGKPTKMVEVPDLTSLTQAGAKKKLESAGLVPEFVERALTTNDGPHYVESGYVISQEPAGDSGKVVEGTKVTVYVSNGTVEFDLKVEIPNKIKAAEKVSLEIWVDGKQKAVSEELETASLTGYTFKNFISTKNKFDATLRFSYKEDGKTVYVDYAELKVTSMTATVTVVE
ncbi:MAG: PASTA domain-containing protein, partial [Clostridia bacterium]|nr:PASTA domain-containing protein [Clostridia bacterium]